jgi:signal transduction histidine kinase
VPCDSEPVRRRILAVALSAVVLAVLLLGIPLAVAIRHTALTEERGELERAALRAAATVSPSYRSGDPIELPPPEDPIRTAVYTPDGARVVGPGPDMLDSQALGAGRGAVVDADDGDTLREALPVTVDERVIAIVVASSPRSAVSAAVTTRYLELGGLALLALLAAGAFAWWQASRLTAPMRRLASAATALGAGDFSVRPPVSGVAEIDETSRALAATAQRLEAQIARERAFTTRASHQLRTPLTRLRLELETGLAGDGETLERSAREALDTADHLAMTVDDVLALAVEEREPAASLPLEDLLNELVGYWQGTFAREDRPLRLVTEPGLVAAASAAAVRQVLQVLIDNAYRHGRGTVTITARATAGAIALDVADRGTSVVPWPPEAKPAGQLGLAMARSLAESQGGRLLLDAGMDGTRFTLLVPALPD